MQEDVRQRIKHILDKNNISQNGLSDGDKALQSRLSRQVNRGSRLSYETIEAVLKRFPDVSAEWLITGKGNESVVLGENNLNGVPLYRTEAAAGFGTPNFSIEEKDIEARYRVREFVDASFMLYVHGKSMEPLYNSGDIIAVKIEKDIENIHWGKVYLISSKEDGLLIKRIYDHGTDIICVSENPTFSPIFVHKSDIKGLASVKGTIRIESL